MPRGRMPSLCVPFYPAGVYSLYCLFFMKPGDDDKHCLHLGERCTINLFLSLFLYCGSEFDCGFLKFREKHKKAKTASPYYTFSSYLWAPIKTHAFYVIILCLLLLCILNVTERLTINLLQCYLTNIMTQGYKMHQGKMDGVLPFISKGGPLFLYKHSMTSAKMKHFRRIVKTCLWKF